jgi:hypothetical protein
MYKKLIEFPGKPYLFEFTVADTLEQYNALEDKVDVFENPVLSYGFNICLQMLDNHVLVPRTPSVVALAQAQYEKDQNDAAIRRKMNELREKDIEINTLTRMGYDAAVAVAEFTQLQSEHETLVNPML